MAEYKVTLFLNSGFDAVNIPDPDSVQMLYAPAAHVKIDPVKILQNRFLTSINADWDVVKDCDYFIILSKA